MGTANSRELKPQMDADERRWNREPARNAAHSAAGGLTRMEPPMNQSSPAANTVQGKQMGLM
jgi:hypothetical protein